MPRLALVAAGVLAGAALSGCSAPPAPDAAALQVLQDRIAIEDLIARYYAHLGTTSADSFGDYFTDDGVFELNGATYQGRDEIVALYASLGEGVTEGPQGMFHMMLSNAVIEVDGDTARARFLWTGVDNPADPTQPPVVREQGREYDLLVRTDGRWLISKRVVIADSGLPAAMLDTWERKAGYEISPTLP